MKEEALTIIKDIDDTTEKLNILREYIQVQVLRSLHESEAFVNLSFVGGTALRFIFNLPRFSEDLDFALEGKEGYAPEAWMKKIKNNLSLAGFNTSLTWNNRTTVHKAWIKIEGLMYDAGLTAMQNQELSIKLEIDTNPPAGAHSTQKLITRHAMLSIKHYDLPSLMAGKIHALITRKYPKGRDWYDLLWYRSQQPAIEPNLIQLQNALDQTQGKAVLNSAQWKEHLIQAINNLDCSKLAKDVTPFLEHQNEATLITTQNIHSALNP